MSAKSTTLKKTCFVISPIGEMGSEVRRKADLFLNLIVKDVLEKEPFNYRVIRADEIKESTMITPQVIELCISSDLVIADLTDHNANAFFELAIAFMAERPVITMIEAGQKVPFDNNQYRTIDYRTDKMDFIFKAKAELTEYVQIMTKKDFKVSNAITSALGNIRLSNSTDTRDQVFSNVSKQISMIAYKIDSLDAKVNAMDDSRIPFPSYPSPLAVAGVINPINNVWSAHSAASLASNNLSGAAPGWVGNGYVVDINGNLVLKK